MKLFATVFVFSLFSISLNGQSPAWQWANNGGGLVSDEALSMATDAAGNVIVCGKFTSSTVSMGSTTLTNADNSGTTPDVIIAKYNTSGALLWAKSAGGTSIDIANSITTDAIGNVFVCGYFQSPTIVFGTTTLTNVANGYNYFVVKYDAAGNVLWAKSAGGSGYESANGIATDASGNVIVAGYFSSSSFSIGSTTLNNAGNFDAFIAKYDGSGNVLWAKYANGLYLDQANAVTTDVSGNIYVTGYYGSNSLLFGTVSISHTGTNNQYNIFTAKYNASGVLQWVKQAGSYPDHVSYSICTDASSNVYVTGYYSSATFSFGTSTLTNPSPGYNDIMVLKYDAAGNEVKAIGIGNPGNEAAQAVKVDASGNIYLSGWYQLADLVVGNDTLVSAGGLDGFLIKLDSNGTPQWSTSIGGTLNDQAYGLAIDASGNAFVTGYFQSSLMVLGSIIVSNTAPNGASSDIYIGKINNSSVGFTETSDPVNSISIYPNPLTDATTITFHEFQSNAIVSVYDAIGNEIKSINFSGDKLVLEKGDMQSGIYFVKTVSENRFFSSKKLIIQ
ncbi:MAG: SBBP repeat-containing protein [Arcticibacter sp.]